MIALLNNHHSFLVHGIKCYIGVFQDGTDGPKKIHVTDLNIKDCGNTTRKCAKKIGRFFSVNRTLGKLLRLEQNILITKNRPTVQGSYSSPPQSRKNADLCVHQDLGCIHEVGTS